MSKPLREVSLVIPGLLDLPATTCKATLGRLKQQSSLEHCLSRAEQGSAEGRGLEATLFGLFQLPVPAGDLPVAAVSYRADSREQTTGWCMRADPVHLIPDRDQLVLMGPETLDLSLDETESLQQELNAFFAQDGWRIEALNPQRWYLHAESAQALETWHLSHVRGRSISEYLPAGSHGKQWQHNMNEVQMLLHNSEVNLVRRRENRRTVSSLWFWGGGEAPVTGSRHWTALWSNEPVSTGLALITHSGDYSLPLNAREWLARAEAGNHLVVIDELQQRWFEHSLQDSQATWQEAIQSLQADWIAPLLSALMQGDIQRLTLYTCEGRQFILTRKGLRRWWRRRKPLLSYCP